LISAPLTQAQEKSTSVIAAAAAPTSGLQRHSFGVGLGETFLAGKFARYGEAKITMDAFYSYSASHSFDLLINGHYTSQGVGAQKVKLPGLTVGIKSKFFNFDSFSPFIVGGLGFYRPEVRRFINGSFQDSETKIT